MKVQCDETFANLAANQLPYVYHCVDPSLLSLFVSRAHLNFEGLLGDVE